MRRPVNWYIKGMTSSRPAVEEASRKIIDQIMSGRFTPGSRIPSERDLATELGVSRMSARAALQDVAAKGLLYSSAQRGWYVVEATVSEPPAELQSFTEMAQSLGLTPSSRIIKRQTRTGSIDEARQLSIAPSSPVVEIRRLRALNGRPVNLEDLVFPQELLPWLATKDLTNQSIYALLADHGHPMSHSRYTVQAENADAELAKLLELKLGGAILVATEVAHDVHGTIVLFGKSHYRGDAYRFTANLWRPR